MLTILYQVSRAILKLLQLLLLTVACASCAYEIAVTEPLSEVDPIDLVGIWEARYSGLGSGTDRLILHPDGTFSQAFENQQGYKFETGWRDWRLERQSNNQVYLILMGARYYRSGVTIGELEGKEACPTEIPPCSGLTAASLAFFDPDRNTFVEMRNQLILKVKMNQATGELLLEHLRTSVDDVKTVSEDHYFHRTSKVP